METSQPTKVTVQAVIQAPVEKVWRYWTEPDHITKWNQASEDWHAPRAENDLRVGGKFLTRMEAKDGSMGFDFGGVYDVVNRHEAIGYTMEDGRRRRGRCPASFFLNPSTSVLSVSLNLVPHPCSCS
jgi:uncharacterized protein YndB with AHSA1/START domain